LYDVDLELEPVLQVLCGRALEQGLIEVKEEFEMDTLAKHKAKFRQLRESELLETQRMEAICARRQAEVERRNAQIRTNGLIQEEVDRKILSRLYSKDFLKNFKRNSLNIF